MTTSLQLFILTSIFITTAIEAALIPPSPPPIFQDHDHSPSPFAPILAQLGFHELATAADSHSSTTTASWRGPTTIFAPTDASLLTCPSCSVRLLLQEHTVAGLYPFRRLHTLSFGTKIETLASNRCITITSEIAGNSSTLFAGGMEITRPDLYNNGAVVVHGIQGFVSHLSPISCNVELATSLSFPPPPPMEGFFIMRLMLDDAMLRLRISGFSVLALALRVKYSDLLDMRSMTIFALDDEGIFAGGHSFVSDLCLHVVPNRRLMEADLESLPAATVLPTMEWGRSLVVTTRGGEGPLEPMRLNYVKVTIPDLIYNLKIAVHGVARPFPRVNQTAAVELANIGRCGLNAAGSEVAGKPWICEMASPTPAIGPTVEIEGHHGF
ncbi:Fasciclin-like arabinogalactan protein [Actinidia chinensis var. chinensis]|uniref:Fasciclin-like arabinogalactan protein n=1 Tax=Actinidia chinensis var. chinensis TaxID=1590841 RepID=A0A2R6P783_ACTCC|nr:Fasciclin-like arabinogalactan protein [Actinidia chinensis var. chinensis]